jgi:uncharacterized protein (TIGR01244 family)
MHKQLDDRTLVGPQVTPDQVAGLSALGITMLINNRPDGEDADQPRSADIEHAARDAGIAYRHIPILRGIGPGDVSEMRNALRESGEGKVLAFCRSGTRSALTWALAECREGMECSEVERRLTEAGFDPGPIAHLL